MTLKSEVNKIKKRNKRVEADKAWETSKTRRAIISIATYLIIVWWLYLVNDPSPWINSVVPTVLFVLSTLTLRFIKSWWIKNFYRR
jgi:hypothetical protein